MGGGLCTGQIDDIVATFWYGRGITPVGDKNLGDLGPSGLRKLSVDKYVTLEKYSVFSPLLTKKQAKNVFYVQYISP